MGEADSFDKLLEGINEQEVKKTAYNAVESASSWLARRRREADDSNTDPYSDPYTTKYAPGEDDSGYMSSAEGMTALFMVLSESQGDSALYLSPRIEDDILTDDVEWMLTNDDEQGIEDGVYRATPYLPRDATTGFTDAVSFTTTTLQEALKIPEVDVDESRLKNGLHLNKEWLINNYIEAPTETGGIGWAWCGSEDMDEMEQDFPPQRYFTFSATVALADLYADQSVETDDEELEEIFTKTLEHLLSDYWTEIGSNAGWTEFDKNPYGEGLEPGTYNRNIDEAMPSLFSTSNTLFAAAYISQNLPNRVWDNADISETEIDRIHSAIDFLLENVTTQITEGTLEETSAVYKTGAKEKAGESTISRGYTDGSLPYTILNTLIAISNAGAPFDYEEEKVEKLQLATADYILKNCWTGDTGFKHFEEDRSEEPVVVYTTQLAIESLLWFGLEPPEDDVKNQIIMELEETQEEIAELLEDRSVTGQSSANNGQERDQSDVLARNYKFSKTLIEAQHEYEVEGAFETAVWWEIEPKLSNEVKNEARSLTDNGLESGLKKINVFEFLSMLNECYFANSKSEFDEALKHYKEENDILLLKPQRDIIAQFSELDSGSVKEFDKRSEHIVEVLETFKNDPLIGHDEAEVATDFRDRIEGL